MGNFIFLWAGSLFPQAARKQTTKTETYAEHTEKLFPDFAEKNERKNQAGSSWISRKNFQVIQKILPEMTGVAPHKKTGKSSHKKQWLRPQNFSPCRIHRVKNYGYDTRAISVPKNMNNP